MKKLITLWIVISCISIVQVSAQVSHGGVPYSFANTEKLSVNVPEKIMPFVDVKALIKEDSLEEGMDMPWRFGKPMDVDFSTENSGKWETLENGDRIWRLRITSPGAVSINLIYSYFDIPPGSRFFVYDNEHKTVLGSFTDENVKESHVFSTSITKGETTTLEYYEPADYAGFGFIEVSKVIHGYKDIFNFSGAKDYGLSGPCHIDINDPIGAPYVDQKKGVAMIMVADNSRICSGSMIKTVRPDDFTPYFLTANHCGGGEETWIFMFNYEAQNLNNHHSTAHILQNGADTIPGLPPPPKFAVELTSADFNIPAGSTPKVIRLYARIDNLSPANHHVCNRHFRFKLWYRDLTGVEHDFGGYWCSFTNFDFLSRWPFDRIRIEAYDGSTIKGQDDISLSLTLNFIFYPQPNISQTISGSELIACDDESDFLLVKLIEEPPPAYHVYYNGWDRTATPSHSVCISHPKGDIKKIALDNNNFEPWAYFDSVPPGTNDDTHWKVAFDQGTTEGGSSGGPLFKQNSKLICGQLHGGNSNCNFVRPWLINGWSDWCGRFDYSWNHVPDFNRQLKHWLDNYPATPDPLTCQGKYPPEYRAEFKAICTKVPTGYDLEFNDLSSRFPSYQDPSYRLWSTHPSVGVTINDQGTDEPEIKFTIPGKYTIGLYVEWPNGSSSTETKTDYITVGQYNLWTGAVDNQWSIAGNWTNSVPAPNDTAIIPSIVQNWPIIKSIPAETGMIEIQSGGKLIIAGNGSLKNTSVINKGLFDNKGFIVCKDDSIINNGYFTNARCEIKRLINFGAFEQVSNLGLVVYERIDNYGRITNLTSGRIDLNNTGILINRPGGRYTNFGVHRHCHGVRNLREAGNPVRFGTITNFNKFVNRGPLENAGLIRNEWNQTTGNFQFLSTYGPIKNFHGGRIESRRNGIIVVAASMNTKSNTSNCQTDDGDLINEGAVINDGEIFIDHDLINSAPDDTIINTGCIKVMNNFSHNDCIFENSGCLFVYNDATGTGNINNNGVVNIHGNIDASLTLSPNQPTLIGIASVNYTPPDSGSAEVFFNPSPPSYASFLWDDPDNQTSNPALGLLMGTYHVRFNLMQDSIPHPFTKPPGMCDDSAMVSVLDESLNNWVGSNGTDWFTNLNWSKAFVPNASGDAIIPLQSNMPIIKGDIAVCSELNIFGDASVTIGSTGKMTSSSIKNFGVLKIESDSIGTGSLINCTPDLNAIVERYYEGGEWHFISPPISNALSGLFTGLYLQGFFEPTNSYFDIEPVNIPLVPMEGYALWNPETDTAVFDGYLNTGGISHSLTRLLDGPLWGWNLVGNPYPSSIDWDAVTGWTKTNVANTIYIHVNSISWASYVGVNGTQPGVGTNGGSRYIAPGQGFFVNVPDGVSSGSLGMNDNVRIHNQTEFFKATVPNLLMIEVSGETYHDESAVRFIQGASDRYDPSFDALKLFGEVPEAPQLYSLSLESRRLSINSLPETESVQLGLKVDTAGVYSISATEVNDLPYVFLEDKETGRCVDLKLRPYSFAFNGGQDEQRFVIHFKPYSPSGSLGDFVYAYSLGKDVYVSIPDVTTGDITIYNMIGQKVTMVPIGGLLNKITLNTGGNYLVKVRCSEYTVTEKVFVN